MSEIDFEAVLDRVERLAFKAGRAQRKDTTPVVKGVRTVVASEALVRVMNAFSRMVVECPNMSGCVLWHLQDGSGLAWDDIFSVGRENAISADSLQAEVRQ